MTEWQGYDLTDFPELSDPEDTIREALRDTIGDGEGIDDAVMRKFKSKVKAEALREFVDSAQDLLDCSGDTRWKSRVLNRADEIEEQA